MSSRSNPCPDPRGRRKSFRVSIGLISRQCRRAGVFIKARWAALARPVEPLLARAEALLALELELELAQGLGLPCTPQKSQAGRGQA